MFKYIAIILAGAVVSFSALTVIVGSNTENTAVIVSDTYQTTTVDPIVVPDPEITPMDVVTNTPPVNQGYGTNRVADLLPQHVRTVPIVPVSTVFDWSSVSQSELIKILTDAGVHVSTDLTDIRIGAYELTGDGQPEALAVWRNGNYGVATILLYDPLTGISVAQQKDEDGTLRPVDLTIAGQMMYSFMYRLLPGYGFYSIQSQRTDISNPDSRMACSQFDAYTWNPIDRFYEWNRDWTDLYRSRECPEQQGSLRNGSELVE